MFNAKIRLLNRGDELSIFDRLIKLYKRNRDSGKTPLEDYTTEVLVGILEERSFILDLFVNQILRIEGEGFRIESQKKYCLEDDTDCIVDIVIENGKTVCFLENKVNASEGERQLERYTQVLNNLKKSSKKNTYLRYCTKYYDKKEIREIDFYQFRWKDVYKFLNDLEKDSIIDEYIEFLRGEGMATEGEFNFQDLIVLSQMNSTFSKINECLDDIKDCFEINFGKSRQTKKDNGIWRYKLNLFCDGNKYDEIYAGVRLIEENGVVVPYLNCGFNFSTNSEYRSSIEKSIMELIKFDFYEFENDFVGGYFKKPLSDILSSQNQFEEIEKWYIDQFKIIKNFIEQTDYLDWSLE